MGMVELPTNFTCYINDASCKPVCNCNVGYFGESCSYTAETQTERVNSKLDLLQGLQSLIEQEDVSTISIENWINSLLSIATSVDDFSDGTANHAIELMLSIISIAEGYDVKKRDIQSLQAVIDYTAGFVAGRLGWNIENLYPTLNLFIASIIPKVVPGETLQLNTGKFRYSAASFLSTDTKLEVALGMDSIESYNQDFFHVQS
jgi:hypothetical protein